VSDWSFARVWRGLAEVAPDRDALVCGDTRLTFAEFDNRAARLASVLDDRGVGAGDKVAIDMVNRPEYLETFFAAQKLGAVPVNVNYRYLADEVRYLLDDADARAVVHDAGFTDVVAAALAGVPEERRPLAVAVGEEYDRALAVASPDGDWSEREPTGDDLVFLYTGGTTGMPKGVMWRSDDLYVALWQMGRPGTEPPDPIAAARAGKQVGTCLPACPLMHGTGLFIALSTLSGGGAVVLVDSPHLDPVAIWDAVEREAVAVLTIVGDVFARPLLGALDAEPGRWDLSTLRAITSSGVTWSPETKAGLLKHAPHATLIDSLGASEGIMTRSASTSTDEIKPARFAVNDRVKVLKEETGEEVAPGSDEVGLVAVAGRLPLGYWKDDAKTAQTFRTLAGVRYSIPGDYASVDADGTIRLLGRGSACINTGGEKVYPEEVELLLLAHPSVGDCVVVGVPDERFGETVVAVVERVAGSGLDEDELGAFCRGRLAGYKRPKRFVLVDDLRRSAAGKADYRYLRTLAAEHADQGGRR
jgi:acyl-CoA synthetase (AMP-forming)/AMP-acid ligase II